MCILFCLFSPETWTLFLMSCFSCADLLVTVTALFMYYINYSRLPILKTHQLNSSTIKDQKKQFVTFQTPEWWHHLASYVNETPNTSHLLDEESAKNKERRKLLSHDISAGIGHYPLECPATLPKVTRPDSAFKFLHQVNFMLNFGRFIFP